MRYSLWQKLLGLFLAVFMGSVGGLTYASYHASRNAVLEEFKIRGRELTKAIASESKNYYLSQDVEGFTSLLQTLGEAEGVLAILAYDASQSLWIEFSIVDLNQSEIRLPSPTPIFQQDTMLSEGASVSQFINVVLHGTPDAHPDVPGPQDSKTFIGWIRILLDRHPLEERLNDLLQQTLLINGFATLFGGGALVFLLRQSLKIIGPLTTATQEVAKGNLTVSVPATSHDELGQLADSFNQMTQRLHNTTVSKVYVDNILKSMIDSLIVIGPGEKIHSTNQATLMLLEYQESAIIGQKVDILFPQHANPFRDKEFYQLIHNGTLGHIETQYLTKDGRSIPVLFSAAVMKEHDGNIQGIACMAQDITNRKHAEERLRLSHGLLESIHTAQARFIAAGNPHIAFQEFLDALLSLTQSQFGFIGERSLTPDGHPYLKTHAITDISWDEQSRARFTTQAPNLEFHNLNTLLGEALITGKPVLSNNPSQDPRSGGLPPGHPPLSSFLGLPFFSGDKLIGMVGLANRPDGYHSEMYDFLRPLLSTCGNLIEAYQNEQRRSSVEKALKDSVERFDMAVRGSQDGIWDAWAVSDDWFDPHQPVYYSPKFKELLGYKDHEFENVLENWTSRLHHEDRDHAIADLRNHLEHGTPYDSQYRMVTKSGEYRWFAGRGQAIWDEHGKPTRISGSFSDITEQKKSANDLQEANLKLQELDHLRTQFFADISHELRTPLTVIRGEAEVTLRGKDKPIQEYKTTLGRIVQLTKEVNQMVNDLLFLARSESGTLLITKHEFSLRDLLYDIHREASILAQKKSISINFNETGQEILIEGDPQRLKQLFLILIDNAVKYSEAKSQIDISFALQDQDVTVMIADHGRGIPGKDLPHIFERFYRVSSMHPPSPPGAGLGLAIAKWITEAHQGRITVTSHVGSGTQILVTLKISPESSLANPLS